MTKVNHFLRFVDEYAWRDYATANGILTQVDTPVLDDDGNDTGEAKTEDQWSYFTHDHAIANIGVLYNNDAVIDPDTGDVITPATVKPGWHVNWKAASFPADINDYSLTPAHPQQVWAGDPVTFDL